MFSFLGNCPSYLANSLFEDWVNKFNYVVNSKFNNLQFLCLRYDRICIEFSDIEKSDTYGNLSIDQIKERIRNSWKCDDNINDLLERIYSYEDYVMIAESLAGNIRDINPDNDYHIVKSKIDYWFNNIKYSLNILGEYLYSKRQVILYIKNIEKFAHENSITEQQAVEEVFIHELFHFFHYNCDKSELTCRYDYTSKIIKESLASYFEWTYCDFYGIKSASSIEKSWNRYPVYTYPYAGASNIRDIPMFIEIFNTSLNDMDSALRKLLFFYEFYNIKNKNETCVVVNKPQVFVVKNKQSFTVESIGNYLFAPDDVYHKDMKKVKSGDIMFHIFDNKLHAISVVKDSCYNAYDKDHGKGQSGLRIDSMYTNFPIAIDISSLNCFKHQKYILFCNNSKFGSIKQILDLALSEYPSNPLLIWIKNILF